MWRSCRTLASRADLGVDAAVEAARAGEAGRGFAVVAGEVKGLSAQTAKATDAIAGQIRAIQASTGAAVEAIQAVGGKVMLIQEFTSGIAEAVKEQTHSSQEIGDNLIQAATASEKAAKGSGGVLESTRQTKQDTNSVSLVSSRLTGTASELLAAVEQFLAAASADFAAPPDGEAQEEAPRGVREAA